MIKFLSVLGDSTRYEKTKYYLYRKDEFVYTKYAQIGILELIKLKEYKKYEICIFTTKKAELAYHEGLNKEFTDLHYNEESIKRISIPDGNNTKELWLIFEKFFEAISDEDEIIFDITHSFRYLPMFSMIILQYAKYIKNIKIKNIYYAKYEKEFSPILDLTNFNYILDFIDITRKYVDFLYIDKNEKDSISTYFYRLKKEEGLSGDNNIEKLIKSVIFKNSLTISNSIRMNDGITILDFNYKDIEKYFHDIENEDTIPLKILRPLIDKFKQKLSRLRGDGLYIFKGYEAVFLAIEHKLYTQAYILFREFFITDVLLMIFNNLDNNYKNELIKNKGIRDIITTYVVVIANIDNPEGDYNLPNEKNNNKIKKFVDEIEYVFKIKLDIRDFYNYWSKLLKAIKEESIDYITEIEDKFVKKLFINFFTLYFDEEFKELCKIYRKISEDRNKIAHAGFKKEPININKLISNLQKNFKEFINLRRKFKF